MPPFAKLIWAIAFAALVVAIWRSASKADQDDSDP